MSTVIKAIQIACKGHDNQVDKSGQPYILHPLHVMHKLKEKGYGSLYLMSGVMHDVVEDTIDDAHPITIKELRDLHEFPFEVVRAVGFLTHDEGVSYYDYIEQVAKDDIARAVKLEDLRHNMDVSRRVMEKWDKKAKEKLANNLIKYIEAYDRLVGGQLNR
jgi:(p)ppGpp synthase/HD superfamily hydrolase